MKSLKHIFLIVFIIYSNNFFSSEEDKSFQEQSMLSVLFVQTSAEFAANNIQTYANASKALDIALNDKSWSAALEQIDDFQNKQPAIIIDVDETVLDNSNFQSRTILSGLSYPNGWKEWVNEAKAGEVAGVRDFLYLAEEKGVAIYYLTNRLESLREGTVKNLINLGLPFDKNKNMLLMRKEENSRDKTERRKYIANKNRILLVIGDQLTDFISTDEAYIFYKERKKLAEKYSEMWGTKWFLITNPTYGRWELSIYEDFPESEEEAIEIRKDTLVP